MTLPIDPGDEPRPEIGTPIGVETVDPEQGPRRRDLYLRLGVLAALAVSGVLLVKFTPVGEYFEGERVIAYFESLRGYWWAPLVFVGLYVVLSPLGMPASPLLITGGMVFGFVAGSIYNLIGLMGGAMAAFYVGKVMGREAIVHLAGSRLKRAEAVFQRRGFWPMVQTRFLPIPFAIVSYAAALVGVPALRFFVASLVGLLPATLVLTYFLPVILRAALADDPGRSLRYGAVYMAIMTTINGLIAIPQIRRGIRRRRRYRQVQAERRDRRPPS